MFRSPRRPTFHRDTRQWIRLGRRLDRRENAYHEVVWDPVAGRVFRTFASG